VSGLLDAFLAVLAAPPQRFVDAQERLFWPYWLGALATPILLLGWTRGLAGLRSGLFSRTLWLHPSALADLRLILLKAGVAALLRVPWIAATAGLALSVGLFLFEILGPAPDITLSRTSIAFLYTLVLFLVWDWSRFYVHRLMHRVSWLWAFHQVHHSAEVLTPLTLYRTHPVETILFELRGLLTTAAIAGAFLYVFRGRAVEWQILGVHALGFVFNWAGANLRHSHVWLRFGRFERVFLSPAQHQLHHGTELADQTANFGTCLAVWDRWGGTWKAAPEQSITAFGLTSSNHRTDRVVSMLVGPVVDAWHMSRRKRSLPTVVSLLAVALLARPVSATPAERGGPVQSGALSLAPRDAAAPTEPAPPHDPAPTEPAPPHAAAPTKPAPPHDAAPTEPAPTHQTVPTEPAPPHQTVPTEPAPPHQTTPTEPAPTHQTTPTEPAPTHETAPTGPTPPNDAAPSEPAPPHDAASADPGTPDHASDGTSATPSSDASANEAFELDLDDADPQGHPVSSPTTVEGDVLVDAVVIEARAEGSPPIPGSAQTIDAEELERREYDDVHRVLRSVPGVYVREEDGFGLRPNIGMRGVNSDRSAKITLTEDGILLGPAPYSAPAAYYFPLMTRIAEVRVFKGPASIRFGPSTVGGAIDLRTRPIPTKMTGYVDAAAGMRGYLKGHGFWGMSSKHLGVLLEGVHVQSRGFKELDNGEDTGFGKTELMVKGRYNVDPGRRVYHQLDIKGGFSRERSYETYLGLTDADFEETPYRRYAGSQLGRMTWWRSQGELRYFVSRGSLVDFEAVVYRHDFSRAWRKFNRFAGQNLGLSPHDILTYPTGTNQTLVNVLSGATDSLNLPNTYDETLLIGTNDRQFVSEGVSTTLHVRPPVWRGLKQDIEFGARVHYDRIRRRHTEVGYLMRSGVLVPDTDYAAAFGEEPVTVENEHSAIAGAFHLVDTLEISRVTLTPGARVEVIGTKAIDELADTTQSGTQAALVPGMGIHVRTTRWLGLFAGVHTGFSPVSPGQSDDIDPERSINYELGGRVNHRTRWGHTQAEATGYFNDYYNLTFNCSQSRGCTEEMLDQQFEGGRAFIYGAEVAASQWVTNKRETFWFQASGNYTFTGTQFRSDFTSADPLLGMVIVGDEIPYVPRHVFAVALGMGGRIWGTEFSGAYVGDMRDVAGQGRIPEVERIPRHFVLDFNGSLSITKRAKIYVSMTNMLNTPYMVSRRPYGARPGMPLQFNAGFKYEFVRT